MALLGVALSTTGCDASPYAARVNSQVIKQTALNDELRQWATNPQYVSSFNSSNSSTGVTVAGEAPGSYSTAWVAGILSGMIEANIVRQHLAGEVPNAPVEAASASVSAISQVGWDRFRPAFRQTLISRLADESTVTPPSVPVATLRSVYDHYLQYFFLQICTAESSAFNAAEAKTLAASGVPNGVKTCYDQSQFASQTSAFQDAVLGLAVGKTAQVPTSYGYLVVKVVSRTNQPFTADAQRVLSTAILAAQGSPNTTVDSLVGKAKVQVNPAYGSWNSSQVIPVVPPSVPSTGS
jgi:hypothetical protein